MKNITLTREEHDEILEITYNEGYIEGYSNGMVDGANFCLAVLLTFIGIFIFLLILSWYV